MRAVTAVDEFLDRVLASELLTASQLAQADLPANAPAVEVARVLVRERLLTPFQARTLLAGGAFSFFVTERYKILEHLGRGGMGEVYMVEHLLLRRVVAMKIILTADPQSGGGGAVERFFREARAVAALDHPNVVRVFDMDRTAGGPFLVMEYVDGSNLHAVVSKGGPLPVGRAVDAIRQAAAGLGHAHAAGLVHRDVKPGNMLLDRMGTVKVVDLGLARYRDANMNAGLTGMYDDNRVIGTADFQAPEQGLDSGSADARSDVYGLGAALFYLLTGRVPYPEGTITNKLLAHQMKPPPNAAEGNPEVPAGLAAAIQRMMAKRPTDRPQSMAEARAVLAPWQAAELDPPPAAEMPKHPPSAYRLGICPPPAVVPVGVALPGAMPGTGEFPAQPSSDTPRVPRTAPVSQKMPRPTAVGATTQRMPKPPSTARLPSVLPTSRPPREDDFESAPIQLDPDAGSGLPPPPGPKPTRRGLLVGLGVGAVGATVAGGLLWYLGGCGNTTSPTRPTGGGPTTTTTPPATPTKDKPVSPEDALFSGSGSSFVKAAMEAWTAKYLTASGVPVGYTPSSSGKGVDAMLAGASLFGCTESPVSDEKARKEGKDPADIIHIPLAFGALVPIYNLPGTGAAKLKFTPAALAGIYAGKITRWNDEALTRPNVGVTLPDEEIIVAHRSDASGSTFVWMEYLLAAAPLVFTPAIDGGKPSTEWKWVGQKPKTLEGARSDGLANAVNKTKNAIGYVEMNYALDKGIPFGLVQNSEDKWVEASPDSVTAAAADKIAKGKIPPDLRFSLVDAGGVTTYPICSAVWAVLFAHQPGKKGDELVKFLRWVTHEGQALLPPLKYATLPDDLVKKIDEKLSKITH